MPFMGVDCSCLFVYMVCLAVNQMIDRARLFSLHLINIKECDMVNIGQNIKDELQRQERTVSWLARKLNCTRAAVYRIFDKNSIDTALLTKISQILSLFFQICKVVFCPTMKLPSSKTSIQLIGKPIIDLIYSLN